jgi:hypothetical protein
MKMLMKRCSKDGYGDGDRGHGAAAKEVAAFGGGGPLPLLLP